MSWTTLDLAGACADEIDAYEVVYLGPGLPYLMREHLAGRAVIGIDCSGLVGVGPAPRGRARSLLPAGDGEMVTVMPGGAVVGPLRAAALLRRGWVDVGVIEAGQVDAAGSMAPCDDETAMGELREIVRGAGRLIACMRHQLPDGSSALQRRLTSVEPGFGPSAIALVVTELGIFRPAGNQFQLLKAPPSLQLSDLERCTDAEIADSRGAATDAADEESGDASLDNEDDLLASAAPPSE